jgi:hypothetical protein
LTGEDNPMRPATTNSEPPGLPILLGTSSVRWLLAFPAQSSKPTRRLPPSRTDMISPRDQSSPAGPGQQLATLPRTG